MPYINLHVDLDDIYNEMDRSDKRTMAQWLHDDGILESHPNPEIRKIVIDCESLMEEEFQKNLSKLWNRYYSMSGEDLLLIEQLCKKY
jgi:hypothetical protein